MNAFLVVSLCLCALAVLSDGVTVKVGDFSFPLESVKKLKDLSAMHPAKNPRKARLGAGPAGNPHNAVNLCDSRKLPNEFHVICTSPNSEPLLQQLEAIAESPEVCEICANIACSGC